MKSDPIFWNGFFILQLIMIIMKGEKIMLILAVVLMIAGVGSAIYGFSQNNTLEAKAIELANKLGANEPMPGTIWIIIGAIALVVGVVLLVMAMRKKNK